MGETIPKDMASDDIPPESIAAIDAAFATLDEHLLPHLESSGSDDRRRMARMGDKSEPFVSKAADYSQTHPEFMPGYVDVAAFQRAIRRIDLLRPYQRRFDQYKSMVDDSVGIAGSDALNGALPYYKTTKEAAKKKQPAAVTIAQDLAERFAANRSSKKPAPQPSARRPAEPADDKE
jgi:hypothetical protein